MLKRRHIQRRILAFTLFLGLFTQFQTVFACEFKDGKLLLVCCCDKPGDMSTSCDQALDCDNTAKPMPQGECCQVSFLAGPSATVIGSEQHHQQVLLLDAPQPPPLPLSNQQAIIPTQQLIDIIHFDPPPPIVGRKTYRLSQRFRI